MSKAKTYAELKAQIAALEEQAADARRKEVSQVVADLKATIEAYGITAADLGFRGQGSAVKGRVKPAKSLGPKYRDPKSGATWTGQGRAPKWIANARNRDSFLISAAPEAVAVSAAPAAKPARAEKPREERAKSKVSSPAKKTATRGSQKATPKKRAAAPAPAAKRAAAPAPAVKRVAPPAPVAKHTASEAPVEAAAQEVAQA